MSFDSKPRLNSSGVDGSQSETEAWDYGVTISKDGWEHNNQTMVNQY